MTSALLTVKAVGRGSAFFGVGLLVAASVQAQPVPKVYSELTACRALTDIPARVACYDAILVPRPEATSRMPQVAQPPASTASARAEFGLPSPPPRATPPQEMQGRIAGRFEGWRPGSKLRLDNGQVWEVVDGSSAAYDLDAPLVSIRRGMLGSFFLEVRGVSATPRVRRVE